MKTTSIAATMGPPALTTALRMALPLIPELIVREQRASGDLLPDADLRKPTRSLGPSYHARSTVHRLWFSTWG